MGGGKGTGGGGYTCGHFCLAKGEGPGRGGQKGGCKLHLEMRWFSPGNSWPTGQRPTQPLSFPSGAIYTHKLLSSVPDS